MSKRIAEVCRKQHTQGKGVFPPQVGPYCMGCPIGTLATAVSLGRALGEALPIPAGHEQETREWLDRVEQKLSA